MLIYIMINKHSKVLILGAKKGGLVGGSIKHF